MVTPGMINSHIHVTGEPLTRGYGPDDAPFEENVFIWLCPLYSVHTAAEEQLSAIPRPPTPEGFINKFGQRTTVHLAELGVLGPDMSMTHCVQVHDSELRIMAEAGSHVAHYPTPALKVRYGFTMVGKMPDSISLAFPGSCST